MRMSQDQCPHQKGQAAEALSTVSLSKNYITYKWHGVASQEAYRLHRPQASQEAHRLHRPQASPARWPTDYTDPRPARRPTDPRPARRHTDYTDPRPARRPTDPRPATAVDFADAQPMQMIPKARALDA